MPRKFWRTMFYLEVLSEDEPVPDGTTLGRIFDEIKFGNWSGFCEFYEAEELSPEACAEALQVQGSDPEFFSLDEDGNDLTEEEKADSDED